MPRSKGVVLLAVVALLAMAMRRTSAATRHLIWLAGVMGLLLLPLVSAALPAWRVNLLPGWLIAEKQMHAEKDQGAAGPNPTSANSAYHSADGPVTSVMREAGVPQVGPSATPNRPMVPPAGGVAAAEPDRPWTTHALAFWLVTLWIAGAVIAVLPTLAGFWQLARVRRHAMPLRDESWCALLNQVSATLKLRRRVRLLASAGGGMPFIFGVWRPVLLLPVEAAVWPAERRRLVLLHELAHVRRGDWLTQLLAQTASVVHWFNPLAWLAARQMQTLREQACDDLVLGCGARASDYAELLLALALWRCERPYLTLAAAPMGRRSSLEARLRAVLDSRRKCAALTPATAWAAMILLVGILVPLAMLQAAAPKPSAVAQAVRCHSEPRGSRGCSRVSRIEGGGARYGRRAGPARRSRLEGR